MNKNNRRDNFISMSNVVWDIFQYISLTNDNTEAADSIYKLLYNKS